MTIESIRLPDPAAAPAAGKAAERFLALDSLRGLAASWVVVFHLPSTGHLWPLPVVQHGFLAVAFFFVLSGFVIGASYGDRLASGYSVPEFMLLRLGRIYPLHLFVIGVIAAYELVRWASGVPTFGGEAPFAGNTDPSQLIWNLALLQNVPDQLSWNRPSWSIGVEYWTYMICALLLALTRLRRLVVAGTAMTLPWVLMRGLDLYLHMPAELVALIDCAFAFGIGLFLFDARRLFVARSIARLPAAWMTVIEIAVVAITVWAAGDFGRTVTSLLIYPCFALLIAVFAEQRGLLSKALLTKPMLLLGAYSYSIYMIHQFVQDRLLDLIFSFPGVLPVSAQSGGRIVLSGSPLACDAVTLAMLAIVVALAGLTYRWVETPARLWSRRMVAGLSQHSPSPPSSNRTVADGTPERGS